MMERYYALGGRRITFSSDAHNKKSIGDRYELASNLVKEIGFTHWTVYKDRIPYEIEI